MFFPSNKSWRKKQIKSVNKSEEFVITSSERKALLSSLLGKMRMRQGERQGCVHCVLNTLHVGRRRNSLSYSVLSSMNTVHWSTSLWRWCTHTQTRESQISIKDLFLFKLPHPPIVVGAYYAHTHGIENNFFVPPIEFYSSGVLPTSMQ